MTARTDRFYTWLKWFDAHHVLARRVPALTGPLRFASYAAYRGLELGLGRAHPHERVIAQAAALQERWQATGHPRPPEGPRVLFYTVRGWFVHVATEAVLAKALAQRGADVRFFVCAGSVPQCDFKPASDPFVTTPLCWRCSGFPLRLLAALALPVVTLRGIVDAEGRRRAAELVGGLAWRELTAFQFQGLPLFRYCLPSIRRTLLCGEVSDDPRTVGVVRGYLQSAIVFAHAADALLEQTRPDIVIVTNGLFVAERIMLEKARQRGVRVVSYEKGWPANSVLFNHNQPSAHFEVSELWEAFRSRPLTGPQQQRLDTYLAERARGAESTGHLWPTMDSDRARVLARLHLSVDRPVAVLFTNILWDTALFERDDAFAGMFEWIEATIRWFGDHPELQLVIRVHPAEIRLTMSESRDRVIDRILGTFPTLPPNVRAVPPEDAASSYLLLALADCTLVYTSTIGLEAVLRGKPTVVAGTPHYARRGFTIDVRARASYGEQLLAAVRRGAASDDEVELARRYASMFLFEYMHPFPWVNDQPRRDRCLRLDALEALAPGRDARLDRICDAILTGAPFAGMEEARA